MNIFNDSNTRVMGLGLLIADFWKVGESFAQLLV